MSILVLNASDVAQTVASLTPRTLVNLMALVFHRIQTNKAVQCPQRLVISSDRYTGLFMPARIDSLGTAIKIVAVPNGAASRYLPGSTILLDEETGAVKAIINATNLTAVRTAAGSALATILVGPATPSVLLVFGAGKQIEAHVDLLIRTCPSLTQCIIVNRSANSRLKDLMASLQARFANVHFIAGSAVDGFGCDGFELEHAVASANIICTATSSTKALFKAEWVKAGTHLNLVGSYTLQMVEVEDALIRRAGKVLVDSKEACATEAGELASAGLGEADMVNLGQLVQEDGEAIQHEVLQAKANGDITIFKSVGIGLQDVAIATAVAEKAMKMGLGIRLAYD